MRRPPNTATGAEVAGLAGISRGVVERLARAARVPSSMCVVGGKLCRVYARDRMLSALRDYATR